MVDKTNYEKIIELNSDLINLKNEIDKLKPKASEELYLMGYSMDRIALMLCYGKINILKHLHSTDIKIRKQGRHKNVNG